jgi:hypothetical protein
VKKWFVILMSLLFFGCASLRTQEEIEDERLMEYATGVGDAAPMGIWDGREYGVYTTDIKTAAWDLVAEAGAYEVKAVWL